MKIEINIINFILKSIKIVKPNFDKIKLRIDEGKDIGRYFFSLKNT